MAWFRPDRRPIPDKRGSNSTRRAWLTVEKRPLVTGCGMHPNGDLIMPEVKVAGYFATVRTDNQTALGVVGKDYQIVQNVDAFSFFDAIAGGRDGILYETAGALGNGERIFITAKLPDYIRVGSDDVIEKYLFLTTSHDGSGSITAALQDMTNVVRIRHTIGTKQRLEQAHRVMGIANNLA